MFDPEIPIRMSAVMQQIQRFVSVGFVYYFAATVPVEKVAQLVYKLDERFNFGATPGQRDAARKRGQCSFRLVVYPRPRTTELDLWVLCSEGAHPLRGTEMWRDARKDPILWPFLYELRQMPVPPALRAKYKRPNGRVAINPVTWSWRFRRDELDRIRWNIRHWTQHRDDRISQLVFGLSLAPGFRATREDVFGLHRYIRDQYKKRKKAPPTIPGVPWVVPRRAATMPLSAIVRRVQRGAPTWFPESKVHRKKVDTVDLYTLLETPRAAAKDDQAGQEKADDSPAE